MKNWLIHNVRMIMRCRSTEMGETARMMSSSIFQLLPLSKMEEGKPSDNLESEALNHRRFLAATRTTCNISIVAFGSRYVVCYLNMGMAQKTK